MHIHEKWIDGKRYLDEIRSCICDSAHGDTYYLRCRIHQRGEHDYGYQKSSGWIYRGDETKRWYLTAEAKKPVTNAIRRFERAVAKVESGSPISVPFFEGKFVVLILRRSKKTFDAVFRYTNGQTASVECLKGQTIGKIIRETSWDLYYRIGSGTRDNTLHDLLWPTTRDNLNENPFYKAALSSGDERLPLQIRLFYNLADEEDCRKLGILLKRRVLPALGKEHDRKYTVPQQEVDFGLLSRSGYQVTHRPYFSMRGSTRSLCEINPHTKSMVDAGKEDAEVISFREFLNLFGSQKAFGSRKNTDRIR